MEDFEILHCRCGQMCQHNHCVCVLHNYCEQYGRLEPCEIQGQQQDPFAGRHHGHLRLPDYGDATKILGENMRRALYILVGKKSLYIDGVDD